jgi:hypothetical protein
MALSRRSGSGAGYLGRNFLSLINNLSDKMMLITRRKSKESQNFHCARNGLEPSGLAARWQSSNAPGPGPSAGHQPHFSSPSRFSAAQPDSFTVAVLHY